MNLIRFIPIPLVLLLSSCAFNEEGTLADLRDVDIEIVDTRIDGGLEKAMKSYQKFLTETPESALTPEAIRRLADLNVEKEYGAIGDEVTEQPEITKNELKRPERSTKKTKRSKSNPKSSDKIADVKSESNNQFEKRAA